MRNDGRTPNQLRPVQLEINTAPYAEGSCLIQMGNTKVFCTASVDTTVPKWLSGSGKGWITAEYGMLPRSTHTRIQREKAMNSGRTQEISRLISRALRAGVDLRMIPDKQILVDCDVLQADGGTRTAAITGGYVALFLAMEKLRLSGLIAQSPVKSFIAAVSVGLQEGKPLLDLCYEEDVEIDTDMNFVMNEEQNFIEVQGTAESGSFSRDDLNAMTDLAQKGCNQLLEAQKKVLKEFLQK